MKIYSVHCIQLTNKTGADVLCFTSKLVNLFLCEETTLSTNIRVIQKLSLKIAEFFLKCEFILGQSPSNARPPKMCCQQSSCQVDC